MIKDEDKSHFFVDLIGGRKRAPLFGQWELTCRCNLRCVMCYTDCFNTPEQIRQELALSEILRIMGELQEAGVMGLVLTGGEPLARQDFAEIYTDAVRHGIRVTVFTNGTLITPKVVELWTTLPPEMIEISLHGLGASFDRITGVKGSYDRCLDGVRCLRERNVPLTLKTVGMTINEDEILRIKQFVESLGGVQWYLGEQMRPALDGSEAPLRFQLPQEIFGNIARHDIQMQEEHDRITAQLNHTPTQEEIQHNRCGSRHKFHIDAYGGLQLCSANRTKTYDLRHGAFREGFYEALPEFPCAKKSAKVEMPAQLLTTNGAAHGDER